MATAKWLGIVVAAVLAAHSGSEPPKAAAPTAAAAPVRGGELVYGIRQEADTLDPHVGNARDEARVEHQIFDNLVFKGTDQKFYPWLATQWKVSEDGLSWTLQLKQNVKFHDGTPFNADAVKYNFDRMIDPATKSRKARGLLGPYDRTEVVDQYTVKVIFKRPYGAFLDSLADPFVGMASPTAAKKWGPRDFGKHPVGSGPFVFKEWALKDRIVLDRNPDYNWAPAQAKHQGPAYVDRVIIRPIPEDSTRVAALETGQVQIIDTVPTQDFARLKGDSKYRVVANIVTGVPPMGNLNSEKFPTDDITVRKAIIYGHNSEEISKVAWNGAYPPSYGPLTKADGFYDPAVEKMYPYDKKKAESLLQEAGWKKGSDGIYEKGGKKLLLDYYTFPQYAPAAEVFQAQMLDIGIKVEIRQGTNPAMTTDRQAGKHHVAWDGSQYGDPSGISRNFHSMNIGVANNYIRYRGKDLDNLLEAGESTMDEAKRAKIYSDIQKLIMDKALIAPLYHLVQIFATRAEVNDLRVHAIGEYPILYDVYLKK